MVTNDSFSDNSSVDGKVKKVLSLLNTEAQQEAAASEGNNSMLTESGADLLRKREEEYRDPEKQWIRRWVWLQTAKSILRKKQEKGNTQKIRYLTLPAYHRIDVSLLLKEGLLEVTKSTEGKPEEIYVAAFEHEPTKFALMEPHMPHFKLFGCEDIEKVLTERTNKYHSELIGLFPFDVINLDLTTSLTPMHEGPYSKTMAAIEKIFDIQSGFGIDWALFLTFRNVPDELEAEARKQLFDNLQKNLNDHPIVLEAFQRRYVNKNTVEELEESDIKICTSQSIAKWLVDRAHSHKYKISSMKTFFYTRFNEGIPPYDIYKHVFELTPGDVNVAHIPTKDIPIQAWMIDGLKRCIDQHKCTDVEEQLLRLLNSAPDKFDEIEDEIDSLVRMI